MQEDARSPGWLGEDGLTTRRTPPRVETPRERPNPILAVITDLIYVSTAAYLLLGHAWQFLFRPLNTLVLVREVFVTVYLLMTLAFLAVRKNARAFTTRKRDYLYTILGFSTPILFEPSPYSGPALLGASLEVCGLVFVASAFLYLNRSFGLSPENRGIKTAGVYRLVRHPMYLGYILAEVGYVLDNFSDLNLFVLIASVLFLLLRLSAEEQLLRRDPNYRKYSSITRWKLVPFLF